MNCCVYTPQEEHLKRLQEGNQDIRKGRERIYRIIDRYNGTKPAIDVERGLYFTQSMKQTEGEMLVLRWAKALKHIAENITIYIDDDTLIVGRGGKPGRYGLVYPELDGNIMDITIKDVGDRKESSFSISEEDGRIILEEICPYWKDKSFWEDLVKALPEETLRLTYDPQNPVQSRHILDELTTYRSSINWVPDYEKALKRGFKSLKEEAQNKLDALDSFNVKDTMEKKPFLEAMILVCDAIVLWARRHGDKATELAQTEKDPVRKQELLEIAERCYWVPENPARNFREAVQSQWFVQMFSRLEQKTGAIVSNGRMDQYLYPYYKADKEAGILTDQQAMETLECLWVMMAQFTDLCFSPNGASQQEGWAHWEAVTIGGQTRNGNDATNELSYLFLRSKRELPLNYPDLAARIHTRSPQRFLREVALTIKDGAGYPKLFNDEEIVLNLVGQGAPLADALDYSASGCAEVRMPNRDTFTCGHPYLNLVSCVEMALYNGQTFMTGEEQIGLKTGDPCSFSTWEEFWNAYEIQLTNLLKHAFVQEYNIMKLRPLHFACPLNSVLHDLCMESCIDLHQNRIPGGIDIGFIDVIGYATAADSLAAIKKLVFEDKTLTMKQVIDALRSNFEGKEVIRQMMLHAPKYGNNDPYVDNIAQDITRVYLEYAKQHSHELGIHVDPRMVPVTGHVSLGKSTGATPNGRIAGFPLSDGASASHGSDTNGPTAVLLSNAASKLFDYRERGSRLINIKFTPSSIAGEDGIEKLISYIRAWCDLKLWFIQFNVINKETLLAAKETPENYKGLIVRVAGYSAYFVELSSDLQNDIIERTQQAVI